MLTQFQHFFLMEWKRNSLMIGSMNKPRPRPLLLLRLSILVFTFCALFNTLSATTTSPETGCAAPGKADLYSQQQLDGKRGWNEVALSIARRYLSGPGSSPPRCTSKCGKCTPCKPVHVPVPPGTPVTAEYYPEAWRCKCGNKLYMP